MNINLKALEALELKLAEYRKENGAIAEHESSNLNCNGGSCFSTCSGTCRMKCASACSNNSK